MLSINFLENLVDAWFPAIVVKENEDNTFLMKYYDLDARVQKDIVDFQHVHPPSYVIFLGGLVLFPSSVLAERMRMCTAILSIGLKIRN